MVGRPWLLVFLVGCSIPEADFPDELAETYCDRAWHCEPDDAQDVYGSVGDCEDYWSFLIETWLDLSDFLGEEYIPEEGPACVRSIRWASCDEFEEMEVDDFCPQVLD